MNYLLVVQDFVRTPAGSALSENQQSYVRTLHEPILLENFT